ncbi:hypothetical protein BSKO_00059 [Bryopsis sp. KO-2023]|nr:hypothetical protein BSKO_00059 [Bryopsis sp. KO-2023]
MALVQRARGRSTLEALLRFKGRLSCHLATLLEFLKLLFKGRARLDQIAAGDLDQSKPAQDLPVPVDSCEITACDDVDADMPWGCLSKDLIAEIVSILHFPLRAPPIGTMKLVNRHWCEATNEAIQSAHLSMDESTPTTEILKKTVRSCQFLQRLDLKGLGKGLTDSALADVSKLFKLERLNLTTCGKISSDGLGAISNLACIDHLVLRECVTLESLENLAPLKNLAFLDLSHCDGITNDGLASVSKLPKLIELVMYRCKKITNEGVHHLGSMDQLTALNIGGCMGITHEGLTMLQNLHSLRRLSLPNDAYETRADTIGDDGLRHLTHFRKLEYLDLCFRYKITDHGMDRLALLTSLQELHLAKCKRISDEGLTRLTTLSNLTCLDMWGCVKISDSSLESITKLKGLRHIDLSQCTRVTDRGVPKLRGLTSLAHLNLEHCKRITSVGLSSLKDLTSLTSLVPPSMRMSFRLHSC